MGIEKFKSLMSKNLRTSCLATILYNLPSEQKSRTDIGK